jgi:hypothetical protein
VLGAKKRQNKITEYRVMLMAWKAARVITYAGYILGFPNDTPASIERDIEIIKRELPVDLLEFFYLTLLPGSEDHRRLIEAGTALDPDLNKYDLNHVTTAHPRMSREEWERTYQNAWQRYYTIDHIETVLRRVASVEANASNALFLLMVVAACPVWASKPSAFVVATARRLLQCISPSDEQIVGRYGRATSRQFRPVSTGSANSTPQAIVLLVLCGLADYRFEWLPGDAVAGPRCVAETSCVKRIDEPCKAWR